MEDARAYQELRVGFTAAVSHELRTPLARLLAILETAALPGTDRDELLSQAREEVEQMAELVNDVLFLSELESGREVVALGTTEVRPVLEEVRARLADSAERAEISIRVEAEPEIELPLRRRMLQTIAENLAQNAIRYAGPGATVTLGRKPACCGSATTVEGSRKRSSPVSSSASTAAIGLAPLAVPASGSRSSSTSWSPPVARSKASGGPGRGLQIECRFPAP